MASQIPALRLFDQPFIQAQIKEDIKGNRHWPFVRGIHPWPVNSPLKGPVTRKMFPFDDVFMFIAIGSQSLPLRLLTCEITFESLFFVCYFWQIISMQISFLFLQPILNQKRKVNMSKVKNMLRNKNGIVTKWVNWWPSTMGTSAHQAFLDITMISQTVWRCPSCTFITSLPCVDITSKFHCDAAFRRGYSSLRKVSRKYAYF